MKNNHQKMFSIQTIRIKIRWMTIVLFGLFFLLYIFALIDKGLSYNLIDFILSITILIYVFGMLLSYKKELISGYILVLSSIHYLFIQHMYQSYVFENVEAFFLIIPGVGLVILGFVHRYDYIKSAEIERLNMELEDIKQSYTLTKSMLDIVPDMIRNDDLDFILQRVLEKAIESIPKAHAGSIILKIDDKMEFRAAVGYNIDLLKKLNLKFEDILQYKLGAIHDPVIINDVETYNTKDVYHHASMDIPQEDQIVSKAMMTHVIMYQHQIFGFINIDNLEDPKAFSTKDKNVIKRVTKHIESIIENQSLIESVYKMSRYDALTGAFTRRYYEKQIEELHKFSHANSTSFSIITFDLDDLKVKNDLHGHEAGDLYLHHFANVIRDVMPKQSFLSRVGGDEFVLVIKNSNQELALQLIDLIKQKANENQLIYNHQSFILNFSYGISSYPNDAEDLSLLMRLSDQRMYDQKRKKENK